MEQILHQNQPTSVRPKLSFLYYWQQIAAILLLPLLIVSAYLYLKPASQIAETYQELFTPYGTWSVVNLPDGSKVWLNAGSSLKYPTQFNDKQRVVSMQGEAYFEVESDKEHPFIVKTSHTSIRVTGTSFNVRAYADEDTESTTLISGTVRINSGNEAFELVPNQHYTYNKNTGTNTVANVNTDLYTSWESGSFIFLNVPLENVMSYLSKWYGFQYSFEDEACLLYTSPSPRD